MTDREPRAAVPADVATEIARYVEEALARFAAPGTVSVQVDAVVLTFRGAKRSVALGTLAENWARLDESARRAQANLLARGLKERSHAPARRGGPIFVDGKMLFAAGVVALLFAYAWWQERGSANTEELSTERTAAAGVEKEALTTGVALAEGRASRACAQTMARVVRGGSVSIADTDGWVVDLLIAKAGASAPLDTHPSLQVFVEQPLNPKGSRFIWPEEPELRRVTTEDTRVHLNRETIGEGKPASVHALRLSFRGGYVDSYFSPEGRARYYHIASALSEKLEATHSALVARCFDDHAHSLGSWFRGVDAGAAASSLVYFMGTFARPSHLAVPFYRRPGETEMDRLLAFQSITTRAEHVDRASLATVVGSEGGMATGKAGDAVVITFPFTDGNRAARASRSFARVLSLASAVPEAP